MIRRYYWVTENLLFLEDIQRYKMSADNQLKKHSKKNFKEYNVDELLKESDDEDEDDEEFMELYKKKGAAATSSQAKLKQPAQPTKASNTNITAASPGSGAAGPAMAQKAQASSKAQPAQPDYMKYLLAAGVNLEPKASTGGRAESILQPQNMPIGNSNPYNKQQSDSMLQATNKPLTNVTDSKAKLHNPLSAGGFSNQQLLESSDEDEKVSSQGMDFKHKTHQPHLSDEEDDDDIDAFISKVKNQQSNNQQMPKKTAPKSAQSSNLSQQSSNQLKIVKESSESDRVSQQLQQSQQDKDILDIIENNERFNELGPDRSQASQLLSFDKRFYQLNKRRLFEFNEYDKIQQLLKEPKKEMYKGVPSAIAVVQTYLFVGNSNGGIRVFDLKTQKEQKPLADDSTVGKCNKVTTLDISHDGGFMLSGYKSGQLALWDLVNYKLVKVVNDLHTTDVINAKIYYTDDTEALYALSAEDAGRVQFIKFYKKNFIGGYSSEAQFLFKHRLQGTTAIALQKQNELYPCAFCERSSLVAFGALNELVLCQMRPSIKEIFQVNKPSFLKVNSACYADWGFGLTPAKLDKTVPILAFAWDRLIQLLYINEEEQTLVLDGFYYSTAGEITSLHFIGESVLFVLLNNQEVRVLYTKKFYLGTYELLAGIKDDEVAFKSVQEVLQHAELEKGKEVADIKRNLLQVQNVYNLTQSVKRFKNQIFFMGQRALTRGKVFTWREYLDYVKFKENADWSAVLKTALEIYNGEIKGLARLPDEKEVREGLLGSFMKDMIKDSVQQAIYKFNGGSKPRGEETMLPSSSSLQWDLIAIKSAMEFCLAINSTQLLFSEIFQLFTQSGLEYKFLLNLEPFILSGSFRKQLIPEFILKKIFTMYENRRDYKMLERIIMQLDLSDYSQRQELIATCQVNCMISGLLYLMSSGQEDAPVCNEILKALITLLRNATNAEADKDDIYMILKVDSVRKYEIEKSKAYIGYKLLWILKMFLDGKNFPSGSLPEQKYRQYVYDIVNTITIDQNLDDLISFDSEQFFKVITKVFMGYPLKFLASQKQHYEKQKIKGTLCPSPETIINTIFALKAFLNDDRKLHFYSMIISVQVSQHTHQDLPRINIDEELIQNAVLNFIKPCVQGSMTKQAREKLEDNLIKVIESKNLSKSIIDKISTEIDLHNSLMAKLRVYLMERRMDYVNSFRLQMQNEEMRHNIFVWIEKALTILEHSEKRIFLEVQKEIQQQILTLIKQDNSSCVDMIFKWFDEQYQEQIIQRLSNDKFVQYNFICNLVVQKEEVIARTIEDSLLDSNFVQAAQRYRNILIQHVRLMCDLEINEYQQAHAFVRKDFYPIQECLEICKQAGATLATAVLHMRNGDHMLSLNSYINIIDSELDILLMMKELTNIQQAQDIPLALHQKLVKLDFLSLKGFDTLHKFDQMLYEAVQIATIYGTLVGENAWFCILEFLQNYINTVPQRILAASKKPSIEDKKKVERVRDFVEQRKIHVLKQLPENISLQRLTDRMDLDFKDINTIYESKVHDYRKNQKFMRLGRKLQEKELTVFLRSYLETAALGGHVNGDDRCSHCGLSIVVSLSTAKQPPLLLFGCGHSYHQNCCQNKGNDNAECPLCVKQTLEIVPKSEMKKASRAQQPTLLVREEMETQAQVKRALQLKNEITESIAEGSLSKADEAAAAAIAADGLLQRRLEVFDSQLCTLGLSKSSFV